MPHQNGGRGFHGYAAGRAAEIGRSFLPGVSAGLSSGFTPLPRVVDSQSRSEGFTTSQRLAYPYGRQVLLIGPRVTAHILLVIAMKSFHSLLFIVLMSVGISALTACSVKKDDPDGTNVMGLVEAHLSDFEEAWTSGDGSKVGALYAEDAVRLVVEAAGAHSVD